MRFSIIVPIYKVADYLDDCVQSVKNQTYTDWELILVDDGSPDNCPVMCDEYARQDSRVKVIHQENATGMPRKMRVFAWFTSQTADYQMREMRGLTGQKANMCFC